MRKMEDGLRGRRRELILRHYLLLVVLLVSLQGLKLLLKTSYLLHLCPLACLLLRELLLLVCNLCEEGEGGRERERERGEGEGEGEGEWRCTKQLIIKSSWSSSLYLFLLLSTLLLEFCDLTLKFGFL